MFENEPEYRSDASGVASEMLRRFIAIWCAARAAPDRMPAKTAVDPVELARARLLPYAWLVERTAGRGFVYRLAGEEINTVHRRSLAGRTLDEVFEPKVGAVISRLWNRTLDEGLMIHNFGSMFAEPYSLYSGERVILPLADDGGRPAFIMGVTDYRVSQARPASPSGAEPVLQHRRFLIPIASVQPTSGAG